MIEKKWLKLCEDLAEPLDFVGVTCDKLAEKTRVSLMEDQRALCQSEGKLKRCRLCEDNIEYKISVAYKIKDLCLYYIHKYYLFVVS